MGHDTIDSSNSKHSGGGYTIIIINARSQVLCVALIGVMIFGFWSSLTPPACALVGDEEGERKDGGYQQQLEDEIAVVSNSLSSPSSSSSKIRGAEFPAPYAVSLSDSEASVPTDRIMQWSPRKCFPNANLTRKPNLFCRFCDPSCEGFVGYPKTLEDETDGGYTAHSPPSWCEHKCGEFESGVWQGKLTSKVLKSTYRQLKRQRAEAAEMEDREGDLVNDNNTSEFPSESRHTVEGCARCGTSSFYNSPISLHEFAFEKQSSPLPNMESSFPFTLTSKRCKKSFSYMNSLEMASVFHHHAWADVDPDQSATSTSLSKTPSNVGRGILFSGDSMIRQPFMNIVKALRGSEDVIEFQPKQDLLYVAYEDGDHLTFTTNDRARCRIVREWFGSDTYGNCNGLSSGDLDSLSSTDDDIPSQSGPASNNNKRRMMNQRTPLFVLLFAFDTSPFRKCPRPNSSHRRLLYDFTRSRIRFAGYSYRFEDGLKYTEPWIEGASSSPSRTTPPPPPPQIAYGEGNTPATMQMPLALGTLVEPWLQADADRHYHLMTTPFARTVVSPKLYWHFPSRNTRWREWVVGYDAFDSDANTVHMQHAKDDEMETGQNTTTTTSSAKSISLTRTTTSQQPPLLIITPAQVLSDYHDRHWEPILYKDTRAVNAEAYTMPLPLLEEYYAMEREDDEQRSKEVAAMLLLRADGGGEDDNTLIDVLNNAAHDSSGSPARSANSGSSTRQRYLLDFAGLADVAAASGVGPSIDRLHYSCIWRLGEDSKLMRTNNHRCRDPVNAALVQWMVHQLLVK